MSTTELEQCQPGPESTEGDSSAASKDPGVVAGSDEATGDAVTRFSGESLNSHPDGETLLVCDPTHLGLVPPDVEGATETLSHPERTMWGGPGQGASGSKPVTSQESNPTHTGLGSPDVERATETLSHSERTMWGGPGQSASGNTAGGGSPEGVSAPIDGGMGGNSGGSKPQGSADLGVENTAGETLIPSSGSGGEVGGAVTGSSGESPCSQHEGAVTLECGPTHPGLGSPDVERAKEALSHPERTMSGGPGQGASGNTSVSPRGDPTQSGLGPPDVETATEALSHPERTMCGGPGQGESGNTSGVAAPETVGGGGVAPAETHQSNSMRVDEPSDSGNSVPLLDGSKNTVSHPEGGPNRQTGDAVTEGGAGQTGDAVPTSGGSHTDNRKKRKRKRRRRSGRRKGRDPAEGDTASRASSGNSGTGDPGVGQGGNHNIQQSGKNRGKGPRGNPGGPSAKVKAQSQSRTQDRYEPRDRRAADDSNAPRSGPRAAAAQGSKGGPAPRGLSGGNTATKPNNPGQRKPSGNQRPRGEKDGPNQATTPPDKTDASGERRWLSANHDEVSDEDRKELFDFVTESLEGLGEDFEWETFEGVVQALVDRVSKKCEGLMDNRSTARDRPVNPNQGWWWRQNRGSTEHSSQEAVSDPQRGSESAAGSGGASKNPRPRGSHGARARRRKAARRKHFGPEAQHLQWLFCRNRKSCVREILEGSDTRRCNIPVSELEAYFRNEYSGVELDTSNPPAWLSECLTEPNPAPVWESTPISTEEVRAQLQRLPSNSAPGPDRLPYKVWKAFDQSGSLLARIFEVCRKRRKIPSSW